MKEKGLVQRAYTDLEIKFMKNWLKNNKPKQVGLDMDINKYSMNVSKTQSKLGTNNGYGEQL